MDNAGRAAAPRFRPMLDEIEREALASTVGDLYGITHDVRERRQKLRTPDLVPVISAGRGK